MSAINNSTVITNTITSVNNTHIKELVKLQDSKYRKKSGLFIAQGLRVIETILQAKLKIAQLYTTQELLNQAQELCKNNNYSQEVLILVTDHVMSKISTAITPSGLLAVFHQPQQPDIKLLGPGLVLADIRDPGNMGTLIRTAAACKVSSVIAVQGTDVWSPKVVQASAGAVALVPIFIVSWQELLEIKQDLKLYALVVSGGKAPAEINSHKALLVVGNEAHGIPQNWQSLCDELISLQMPGQTESLNAAIAGSIALYNTFCAYQHPVVKE